MSIRSVGLFEKAAVVHSSESYTYSHRHAMKTMREFREVSSTHLPLAKFEELVERRTPWRQTWIFRPLHLSSAHRLYNVMP